MIDKTDLIQVLEQISPPYLTADWDNDGMQIEPAAGEIGRILIALDLTPEVISEAKRGEYDFIVVHHPMFFGGEGKAQGRNVLQSDAAGRYLWRLLAEPPGPVGVYAAHTSFDAAEGGLGDELRRLIGLTPWVDRMHPDIAQEFAHIAPYTRTGRFSNATDLASAFARVTASLGTGADIRVFGDSAKHVLKVMTVCGGGGDAIPLAVRTGCSLLVTGDVKHHEWRLAEAEGLALIDAGHYYTERPFAKLMAGRLDEALGQTAANIAIDVSSEIRRPYASPAHTKND